MSLRQPGSRRGVVRRGTAAEAAAAAAADADDDGDGDDDRPLVTHELALPHMGWERGSATASATASWMGIARPRARHRRVDLKAYPADE